MMQRFEITVAVPDIGDIKHVVTAATRDEAIKRVLAAHPSAGHISKIETRRPE